ncbi:MAG TPA: thioredoxin family protein [Nitrolancea sp.]|jgi:thiol-disulfide isomerase/thioredoxin|nr:thioredoxin family protein [Nitrolancea sp.]
MLAAERYQQAMNIDDYFDQMTQNRETVLKNYERAEITDVDRQAFSAQPLHVLILTEEWCSDSMQFVPVLAKLATEVPGIEIRVLRRDDNLDLATNYRRKDGYQAIPVFIFFDRDMRELGFLIERPVRVSEEMADETRRFQQLHPELAGVTRNFDRMPEETRAAVKANSQQWRRGQQDRFARYFLDEVAELIQHAFQEQAV